MCPRPQQHWGPDRLPLIFDDESKPSSSAILLSCQGHFDCQWGSVYWIVLNNSCSSFNSSNPLTIPCLGVGVNQYKEFQHPTYEGPLLQMRDMSLIWGVPFAKKNFLMMMMDWAQCTTAPTSPTPWSLNTPSAFLTYLILLLPRYFDSNCSDSI